MEEKMGMDCASDMEREEFAVELSEDESAFKGIVLMASFSSREFDFEEHGWLHDGCYSQVYDGLYDALEEQDLFVSGTTLGLSEKLHSHEEARDLLIGWTVEQPAEMGVVRGFIRQVLLRLYRMLATGPRDWASNWARKREEKSRGK